MKNKLIVVSYLFLASCIVQSPKYTTLERVLSLQVGMSKASVEETLGIKPYEVKAFNDSTNSFIYVYRVIDRKTLAFNTKPVNGKQVEGRYVPLTVTFSKNDKLLNVESCSLCRDTLDSTSKIDISKVTLFVTVTLPVLLIYFGLKK